MTLLLLFIIGCSTEVTAAPTDVVGSPQASATVATEAQPTSRWIVRANDRRAVLVRANGGSLRLVTTISDGDLAVKKTVAVDGSRPWGDPPDVLKNTGGFWKIIRSTGSTAIDGTIKEEFHPQGLVIAPDKIIADGKWHQFLDGCTSQ